MCYVVTTCMVLPNFKVALIFGCFESGVVSECGAVVIDFWMVLSQVWSLSAVQLSLIFGLF